MEYIEILKDLKTRFGKWTSEDKETIENIAIEVGYTIKNKRCKNCYDDAFFIICNKLHIKQSDLVEPKQATEKYIFTGEPNTYWVSSQYGKCLLDEFTPEPVIELYIKNNPKQNIYIKN